MMMTFFYLRKETFLISNDKDALRCDVIVFQSQFNSNSLSVMRSSSTAPPNGGYGWLVVAGATLINATNQAVISVFGLLFGPHFIALEVSKSHIALVMNLSCVFLNLSGLMTAPLLRKFSPRQVAIVGCSLVGSGLMLSSVTTSLVQVLITYSLMVGFGLGLLTPSIFLSVSSYFTTRKSRAIGLTMAGTGFGQMMLPQIVRYFLLMADFQGTALFVGSLSLYGIAGAILFHPVEWHARSEDEVESANEAQPLLNVKAQNAPEWTENHRKVGMCTKIARSMDLSLLGDGKFMIVNIGLAIAYAVSIDFTLILPFFLQVSVM